MSSYQLSCGPNCFTVPTSITTGPDGALWFTERYTNKIGRITTDGTISEYPIPLTPVNGVGPWAITSGSDGALWFTDKYDGSTNTAAIGKIDTSGSVTTYNLTGDTNGITSGPDGALWFTEVHNNSSANTLDRMTTDGTIYRYPTSEADITFSLTIGPDGAIWYANFNLNKITRVVVDTTLSAPTDLTASSPTQNPSLNWSSVIGASTYNIYRDGTKIDSSTTNSYTDNNASEGTDSYYVTAVNSGAESSASNTVNVLVDRTAPTITYTTSPAADSSGWNNGAVTVTFTCADNSGGSGIASCAAPVTLSNDGSNQTVTGTTTDNAGNTASVTASGINIDTTLPVVSNLNLATDPITTVQTTTLTAHVTDATSGVARAEYYTGTDPGVGNGTSMTITNGVASSTVGPYFTPGMYTFYVRTENNAGNWSQPLSVILDVYNPTGGYSAAHGSIMPNGSTSNPGDILPTETGNNLKATLDYTVKYATSTSTTPTGTNAFSWGSICNSPHSNCFTVTTDNTVTPNVGSLGWLIVPGNNTATFQGTATLSQGSTTISTNNPIRVSVTGTTTTTPGHYLLQIYVVGADPNTATPIFQASGDLTGGSVVLHS